MISLQRAPARPLAIPAQSPQNATDMPWRVLNTTFPLEQIHQPSPAHSSLYQSFQPALPTARRSSYPVFTEVGNDQWFATAEIGP